MRVLIRGAGDIATGIALRLYRSHMQVVMTDLPAPTAIRRTVCFSQAIVLGRTEVEGVAAVLAADAAEAESLLAQEVVPVLADPDCRCRQALRPDAEVDAILAKRNLGTAITDAPVVIGIGPGFTAGADCHAVVETMRGHTLGRVIYEGSALPNTNIPGLIGGYAGERVLRAPADGIFHQLLDIGAEVKAGDVIEVRESSRSSAKFAKLTGPEAPVVALPAWLNREAGTLKGVVAKLPERSDIDYEVAEHLIVELYSK